MIFSFRRIERFCRKEKKRKIKEREGSGVEDRRGECQLEAKQLLFERRGI